MSDNQPSIPFNLNPELTDGSQITYKSGGFWKFEIPAGYGKQYRLAQWDDTHRLPRNKFNWGPPAFLNLRARISNKFFPGTFGFGWWNDPFGMGLLSGTRGIRMPVLPQAIWFFYASAQSYLAVREDLPPNGWTASVFKSEGSSLNAIKLGAAFLPGLISRNASKRAIRLAGQYVSQETALLDLDVTAWHTYRIDWYPGRTEFSVDKGLVLVSENIPKGPLGFVLWIDNQYAAVLPTGELKYGWLAADEPSYLEISEIDLKR